MASSPPRITENVPEWHHPRVTPYPLLLRPELVPKIWGGGRLAELFGASLTEPVGEAWLVSDHPKAPTLVVNGPLAGASLGNALTSVRPAGAARRFPLLVKLIDSREPLSIQVHPNDGVARELEGEMWGKSEAWYVLESKAGYVGLGFGVEPRKRSAEFLSDLHLPDFVRRLAVEPGDFVYVPSGEIHYIGPGVLLAEVQQSSDLTYRIHDWGRDGRELHLEKAARALSWRRRGGDELRHRPSEGKPPDEGRPFHVELCAFDQRTEIEASTEDRVLFPLQGTGQMECAGSRWPIDAYHCWVLPAGAAFCIEVAERISALLCRPTDAAEPVDNDRRRAIR
jgi:mannose-6-phosphate isomerase class I